MNINKHTIQHKYKQTYKFNTNKTNIQFNININKPTIQHKYKQTYNSTQI